MKRLFNWHSSFILGFIILIASPIKLYGQLDTVITQSGETLIGTAEKMSQGVLTFDSESGDKDYKVEWKKVVYINTYHHLRLTINKNDIVVAYLKDSDPSDNTLKIVDAETGINLDISYDQILNFEKVNDDFWGKLDMNLNLGYNFAKSTSTHQLTLRTGASYLDGRWGFTGSYDEFFSLIDTVQTRRTEGNLSSQYFLPGGWYWGASSNWFSSDEQQIALRNTFQGGFGKYLLNDLSKSLEIGLGVALNRERFKQDEINSRESFELFASTGYRLYDHKLFDISSDFTGFLNTRDTERYRASFSIDFKWDIASDFDIVWGYSLNFDSKPPNGGEQSDYVLNLTIGWEL